MIFANTTNMFGLLTSDTANIMLLRLLPNNWSVGGVMVSIAAFQAVDLGSIPGQCTLFFHYIALTSQILHTSILGWHLCIYKFILMLMASMKSLISLLHKIQLWSHFEAHSLHSWNEYSIWLIFFSAISQQNKLCAQYHIVR